MTASALEKFISGHGHHFALVAGFIGICLMFSAGYHLVFRPLLWRQLVSRRLRRQGREYLTRIQILKNVQEVEGSLLVAVASKLGAWGKIENLQRQLLQADIFWNAGTFLALTGLLATVGFYVTLPFGGLPAALGASVGLGYLPFLVIRFKKARKARLIEKQMPETMELLARSLRAGHALPSSIELAGKEIADPLGGEMKIVYEEQRLGLGLNEAFKRMGERVASRDLQYFITAVLLQSETGGNLSEIMENIGYLIRERLKLKGKIQALTAEGRFSAIILAMLPFVVFAALTMVNRKYVNTLFTEPAGTKIIATGMVSILLGVLWMRRIIAIKV